MHDVFYLQDHIIELRGEVWAHNTCLAPPLCVGVPVSGQENERSHNFPFFFYDFLSIQYQNCSYSGIFFVWFCFCFHFIVHKLRLFHMNNHVKKYSRPSVIVIYKIYDYTQPFNLLLMLRIQQSKQYLFQLGNIIYNAFPEIGLRLESVGISLRNGL